MAWGTGSDREVDRWIERIVSDDPTFTSLIILTFRKPTQDQLVRLFSGLRTNTHLSELYCSGKVVERAVIQALADALLVNVTLKKLSVGYSKFGEDIGSIDLYCRGLAQFRGSLNVDLSGFHLTSANTEALSYLFRYQTGLNRISLSYNQLDTTTLNTIGHSLLENSNMTSPLALEINGNGFTDLLGFSKYFTFPDFKISELDCYDNPISPEQVISLLTQVQKNRWLKILRINLPEPKDQSASNLDQVLDSYSFDLPTLDLKLNSSLETLLLSGVNLNSSSLDILPTLFTSLSSLTLRKAQLTDEKFLCLNTSLKRNLLNLNHLDLSSNKLTDRSFWSCLELPQLRQLTLFDNAVTLVPSILNPTELPGWVNLTHLDLNCNQLTLPGLINLLHLLSTEISSGNLAPQLATLEVAGNDRANSDQWLAPIEEFQSRRSNVLVNYK